MDHFDFGKEPGDPIQGRIVDGLDIPWLLNEWSRRTPDKKFMIWEPFRGEVESWSFKRLQKEVRQIASALSHRGIKTGDFVIIHLENSPEFVLSWFACAELGAVAVSTNTRSVARDMMYYVEQTNAVCVITQPAFANMILETCPDIGFLVVTDNNAGEAARVPSERDAVFFAELLAGEMNRLPRRPTEAMANLSVQFTSGTTARPKAVLWTHANGIWCAKISASHMRLLHEDRTLVFMPMFHANAQGYSMLTTLWVGGTFVLQPKFSASRFWPLSLKYQLTWLSTIPFALKALAHLPVPPHHYRFWGTRAHLPEWEEQFKVKTMGWWGMTEIITQGIVTDVDHPGPAGTIGRVAPEYEIQIRKKNGELAGAGERGLLFIGGVRGISLFKEYYRNHEANDAAFDEQGWFDTGDLIRLDDKGNLFFSDRAKDMLKVGGENVAASEIESVIMQTGWVNECAVVAQKHDMLDEVPVVFVIPHSNPPEDLKKAIIRYCEENLADFKVPREVRVVETLPRSTLERIAKYELRKQLPAIIGG